MLDVEIFNELGFCGPLPLLTPPECLSIIAHEQDVTRPLPLDWWKGKAASDPFYARLAREERILSLLRPILGNNIVLWGVDVLQRHPNQVHPWHCDIESCSPDGGFASVWIGLNNTNKDSALNVIAGSHRLGRTIQEEAHRHGLKRGEATGERIINWARSFDAKAQVIVPEMRNGDALVFDGRIWHGTHNVRQSGTRTALLLQYAEANRPVRIIDRDYLEWPFKFQDEPLPPLLLVAGRGNSSINRLVPLPKGMEVS